MQRFVAAAVSFALIFISAPPSAWSQAVSVMSGRPGSSSPHSAAGGLSRSAIAPLSMPAMSLAAPLLGGALSAPAVSIRVDRAISAGAPLFHAVGKGVDAKNLAAARIEVAEAAGAISNGPVSASRPAAARMMDRLLGIEATSLRSAAEETAPPKFVGEAASPHSSAGLPPAGASEPAGLRVRIPSPNEPPKTGPGFFRSMWTKLGGFLRVLPDKDRNRQFWILSAVKAFAMLGASFGHTALPNLVAPTKADAANVGYNRAVSWGAQASANLAMGPFVDRASTKKVIVWTYAGCALMMLLVPTLFFSDLFGYYAFAGLIGVSGFLEMTGMTAGAVAYNRILAGDVAQYNRANSISTIMLDVAGVVGSLLAVAFIAKVSAHFGLLSGNALAFGVQGILILACAVVLGLFLQLPRDEMTTARRELSELLQRDGVGPVRFIGVISGQVEGRKILLVEVDGDPALASGIPAEFGGFTVKAVARRRVFKEVVQGFKTIISDRFLRLYLLSTTLSMMSGAALIFSLLPRFLEDVLHAPAGSFGLFLAASALGSLLGSGLMAFVRDPEQMALAPATREFRSKLAARDPALDAKTIDAAASALQGAVPAVFARYRSEWAKGGSARESERLGVDLVIEGAKAVGSSLGRSEAEALGLLEATGAARDLRTWASRRGSKLLADAYADATKGMDRLQRQGRWTLWLHGLSWLVDVALFFSGHLYLAAALMLFSAILSAPSAVVWMSLTTKVVAGSYGEDQGKIYAAMYFYQLIPAIVGVLLCGWLMASLPTMTVLWVTAGVMVLCALVDLLAPALIFPIQRKR